MSAPISIQHRGRVLADRVTVAQTFFDRMRGLLGRLEIGRGEALVLRNAAQIHTFGMRFPIDVLFLDADGRVLHVIRAMRPWRLSRWVRKCRYVVELPAGVADSVAAGDVVELRRL
ncbi:MAG: DUF192 domain-containing protein [Actinomycetota bacterium]